MVGVVVPDGGGVGMEDGVNRDCSDGAGEDSGEELADADDGDGESSTRFRFLAFFSVAGSVTEMEVTAVEAEPDGVGISSKTEGGVDSSGSGVSSNIFGVNSYAMPHFLLCALINTNASDSPIVRASNSRLLPAAAPLDLGPYMSTKTSSRTCAIAATVRLGLRRLPGEFQLVRVPG